VDVDPDVVVPDSDDDDEEPISEFDFHIFDIISIPNPPGPFFIAVFNESSSPFDFNNSLT